MKDSKEISQVFISYAREDQAEAEKIYQYLSDSDFSPWMDVHDIVSGADWLESISQAIRESDFFLACLSNNSVGKPGVLQEELSIALDVCQGLSNPENFLIPVRLEDCPTPDEISQYQWVDLYAEDGWVRLLRALHREKRKSRKMGWGILAFVVGLLFVFGFLFRDLLFPKYTIDYRMIYDICDPSDSAVPVRVGIAPLSDSCPATYREFLSNEWKLPFTDITTLDQTIQSSTEMESLSDYDLVVWGFCDESVTLNYELTTSRSPTEVYEPASLQVTGNLTETSDIGEALIHYQHGDYELAAQQFASSQWITISPEVSLFLANSFLFAGNYEDAITAYKENTLEMLPGVTYNNLGVARFNLKKSNDKSGYITDGLAEFDQAIDIAEARDDNALAVLAYMNRSDIYRRLGSWEEALSDCTSARSRFPKSALPYMCRARYSFSRYTGSGEKIPLDAIERDLNLAMQYSETLPILYFLRGTWFIENKQYDDAVASYEQYFTEMEKHVCLETDLGYLELASEKVNEYKP